ncbi:MAG: cysteinyl-tRNA synthetase [Gammaproteobacteria bacterium]|jgi:cysteinyl-tRNA synthetase
MALKLFNTLSKQKDVFTPSNPERVTMYVCGPTVYSYAHIGNARSAVAFDMVYRVLQYNYTNVIYVRNITDVDDKINKAALDQGVEISVITEKFADIYRADMGVLGVQNPVVEPKATDHIAEMIKLAKTLIAKGHAYAAEGHVLFDVNSFEDYGQLSKRDTREMLAGARVEVAPYKKNPGDFVLWKPSDDQTPGWDSPWGRGRPGWHIECSAMAKTHLGETIDIHGGGHDLTFPHHENELAQSTCASGGKTYAHFWMHNGFVNVNSEKMSKSIGNVLLVNDLIKEARGEAIRLALITAHYRQPLDWSDESLDDARRKLDKLYGALGTVYGEEVGDISLTDVPQSVVDALHDDINTPKALAEMFALAKDANNAISSDEKRAAKKALLGAGAILGILEHTPEEWFAMGKASSGVDEAKIDALIKGRLDARASKDWAEADRIRDELAAMNIEIQDGQAGTTWRVL